jgi:hypothetical protein
MQQQKFYLCDGPRVLMGPINYSIDILGDALKHHGGTAADLPEVAPKSAIDVLYLRLLPERDITEQPTRLNFYHIGQAAVVVKPDRVEIKHPLSLHSFEYCSQLVAIEIDKISDQALGVLQKGYSERIIKSWPQQRAEAAEYTLDNTKEVPLLKGMAERRGIPLATFVEHVQVKVKTTADLTAIILGDAQAANDKMKALETLNSTDNLPNNWFDLLIDIADNWRKNWPATLLED